MEQNEMRVFLKLQTALLKIWMFRQNFASKSENEQKSICNEHFKLFHKSLSFYEILTSASQFRDTTVPLCFTHNVQKESIFEFDF